MSSDSNPAERVLLEQTRFLRALVRGLSLHEEEADDVVQETCLAALQHAPPEGPKLRSWLVRVARNILWKARRDEARRRRREALWAPGEEVPSAARVVEREAMLRTLVKAVLDLDDSSREVILLRYFEDLPPREIAHRLAVPVETVRTRIKRALKSLRGRLEHELGGEERSWSAAFVGLMGLRKQRRAAAVLANTVGGGLLMKSTVKLGIAALIALLIVGSLFWTGHDGRLGETSERTVEAPGLGRLPERAMPVAEEDDEPPSHSSQENTSDPKPGRSFDAVLSLEVVWQEDRTPADGIRATVEGLGESGAIRREIVTDDEGRAFCEELAAGPVEIQLDRGLWRTAELEPGTTTELRVEVPLGVHVSGIVIDSAGAPVPFAELLLHRGPVPGDAEFHVWQHTVGRAAADGTFRLRSVQPNMLLAARAPAHVPSDLVPLFGDHGATAPVEIVLPTGGGNLVGQVSDREGRPIEDAIVLAGFVDGAVHTYVHLPDGTFRFRPEPTVARTDDEGRFEVPGLSPGELHLAVHAPGFAPWKLPRGSRQVVESATTSVEVILEKGRTIHGTVSDSAGRPCRDVVVSARPWWFHSWHNTLLLPWTRTDAGGRFELRGVSEESRSIYANGGDRGTASIRLSAIEEDEWNAVLDAGACVTGRVVDEQDRPLSGWRVVLTYNQFTGTTTKQDGRFTIRVADGTFSIAAYDPRVGESYPVVWQENVRAKDEVVLRVSNDRLPSAYVKGTVRGPNGAPLERAPLYLTWLIDERWGKGKARYFTREATGALEIGPVPPGRYRLEVAPPGFPRSVISDELVLEANEAVDLGVHWIAEPGSVVVELAMPEGLSLDLAEASVWIDGEKIERRSRLHAEGEAWHSGPLEPGVYRLHVHGPGVGSDAGFPVEVASGEEAHVVVPVEAGAVRYFLFPQQEGELGASRDQSIHVVIRNAAGAVVLDRSYPPTFGIRANLALGRYSLLATTPDGRTAEGSFTLDEPTPLAEWSPESVDYRTSDLVLSFPLR